MPLSRARPIDDLYAAVAEYELVLVPDAPLASALNRRLDRPHLGTFATTPRRLAAGRREQAEDRLAFLELIEQTELSWKQASYIVGNILQCWEYQGSSRAILEYDGYADAATETAVEHISSLDTTSRRLSRYQIDDDCDLAVVGIEQFTPLERSILPDEFDMFSPLTEEEFDPAPFHVFDSTAGIIDAVVEAITADTAEDVAVVLNGGSEYSALVESALEAEDIPFYGGPGFIDDPDHRTFLQLLRAAHNGSDTRVRSMRPLLSRLGLSIDIEHDEKRLHELDAPAAAWVSEFSDDIHEHTFGSALDEYEGQTGVELPDFREELSRLGIAHDSVTDAGVDRLAFYLQTYEVPVDRENEGVLLADASAAAFVDRPVVFYLGLDDSWTQTPPRRPWIEMDDQYQRNIRQFQLLLQNGVQQYYLVQDTRGGDPITPCLYFEDLLEEDIDRFSDFAHTVHNRTFQDLGNGFEKHALDVEPEWIDAISQSSMNSYVNSPRDYFFSKIVQSPDKDYFKEGNLFHDFAEFYVNHPDAVDDGTIDEVVDVMLDEVRPFLRSVDADVHRTEYRLGLETIVQYLDENEPAADDLPIDGGSSSWGNFFAEYFDRTIDSSLTERWFSDDDLGIKGKIDLIHRPHRLLDYKSGSKKRASQVVKGAAMDPPSDKPNFQAILYLAYLRTLNPDEQLEFRFFHFLETLDDAVTGTLDFEDTLTTIPYHPTEFTPYVRSEAMFERLLDDGSNACQKTLSKASYADYAAVFEDHDLPDTRDSDELIDSAFGAALEARLKDAVGDYKYVEKGCKQILREFSRLRSRRFFVDDLDAFEEFVDECLVEVNRRRAGEERFPIDGPGGEPNYRYVDNRDLLLEDD
ncbi:PD-(D/E)XK nuclease family protein [Halorientalis brevis]|uniref:PD-(D/E)XK nuclease family protein n=1 Tax=Halorientalis brevis TaxID=1126241 RepID=A0ABD6CGV6_9EURY